MINRGLIKHLLFWGGMLLTFWGAFEQALDAGNHPLFGVGMGIPFLHHWVIGWFMAAGAYFLFTKQDWVLLVKNLKGGK